MRASLFPIDELMSREERSVTQYSMMRRSQMHKDEHLPSFVNPQPSMVEEPFHQKATEYQDVEELVFDIEEKKDDQLPSSPPSQP